jgi:PAS domain S-box-containing protein
VFMDNSPAVVWAKDERGRVVFLNKTGEQMFQFRDEEWYGKTDYDFWPAEIARRLQENDRKAIEHGSPIQFFEETVSPDRPLAYWMTILFPYQNRTGQTYVGGIAIDVTDLKTAEEELKFKQNALRNLIDVQESERQTLCHEFHDGLIQYAVGAVLSLQSYQNRHPHQAESDVIEKAISMLRRGIDDGRRAIRGIRPAVLDDSGMLEAIDDLIDQFANVDLDVASQYEGSIGKLPDSVQTAAYRIVQEALNNVFKHSGVKTARVTMKQADGMLEIGVCDEGCGFDNVAVRNRGFGLRGMVERVRILGGECDIQSQPGRGTQVTARLPICDGGST